MTALAPVAPHGTALVIEASTYRATVALLESGRVLGLAGVAPRSEQQEPLMPAVAHLLQTSGVAVRDLAAVVCGGGPGSFTSLRIAAAVAKGLVRPVVGDSGPVLATVSSLLLIVAAAAERLTPGRYLAVLDALRGDRYAALVEHGATAGGDDQREVGRNAAVRLLEGARRIPDAAVARWASETGAAVIGPGCPIDAWPEAAGAARVWDAVRAVDPATWEPDYGRLAEAQARLGAGFSPPARS